MRFNYGYNYGLDNIDEVIQILPQILPFLIPLFIVQLLMLIVALINLFKKKLPLKDKVIWLIIIIGIQIVGPIVYFAIGSKMLDDKQERGK